MSDDMRCGIAPGEDAGCASFLSELLDNARLGGAEVKDRDTIINEALEKLSERLMDNSFHDFRSEVWSVVSLAMKEQDRNTRHSCAESVAKGSFWSDQADCDVVRSDYAHNACINARAI